MPRRLQWTIAGDRHLVELRAAGASWDEIAAALGISRSAAIERGRQLGATLPMPRPLPEIEDGRRGALPAGHDVTWGALTAGTVLAGMPYPGGAPLSPREMRADEPTGGDNKSEQPGTILRSSRSGSRT